MILDRPTAGSLALKWRDSRPGIVGWLIEPGISGSISAASAARSVRHQRRSPTGQFVKLITRSRLPGAEITAGLQTAWARITTPLIYVIYVPPRPFIVANAHSYH